MSLLQLSPKWLQVIVVRISKICELCIQTTCTFQCFHRFFEQPQNISDDKDVYNYDFTGISEKDALDYLPDTSQIAEVLELAFNLKKKLFHDLFSIRDSEIGA